MESVQIHRLGSDDFTWAEQIAAAVGSRQRRRPSRDVPYYEINDRAEWTGRSSPWTRTFLRGIPCLALKPDARCHPSSSKGRTVTLLSDEPAERARARSEATVRSVSRVPEATPGAGRASCTGAWPVPDFGLAGADPRWSVWWSGWSTSTPSDSTATRRSMPARRRRWPGNPLFVNQFPDLPGPPAPAAHAAVARCSARGRRTCGAGWWWRSSGWPPSSPSSWWAGSCTGRRPAILGALILALMPYHLVVTRQLLLDGPAVLWITLAFWMLARFVRTDRFEWLAASAATLGLGRPHQGDQHRAGRQRGHLPAGEHRGAPAGTGGGPDRRGAGRGEPGLPPGHQAGRPQLDRAELSDLAAGPDRPTTPGPST